MQVVSNGVEVKSPGFLSDLGGETSGTAASVATCLENTIVSTPGLSARVICQSTPPLIGMRPTNIAMNTLLRPSHLAADNPTPPRVPLCGLLSCLLPRYRKPGPIRPGSSFATLGYLVLYIALQSAETPSSRLTPKCRGLVLQTRGNRLRVHPSPPDRAPRSDLFAPSRSLTDAPVEDARRQLPRFSQTRTFAADLQSPRRLARSSIHRAPHLTPLCQLLNTVSHHGLCTPSLASALSSR